MFGASKSGSNCHGIMHPTQLSERVRRILPNYTPPGSLDTEDPLTHTSHPGDWRQQPQGWVPPRKQDSNHNSKSVKEIRDRFCAFFISKHGEIPWQYSMV